MPVVTTINNTQLDVKDWGMEQAAFDTTAQAPKDDRPKVLTGFFSTFFGVDAKAVPAQCRPAIIPARLAAIAVCTLQAG